MKRIILLSVIALTTFIINTNAQDTLENKKTKISWDFNKGTEGQVATFSDGSEAYFNASWVSTGSNLSYNSTSSAYDITYTQIKPGSQSNAVTENDFVSFNLRPKKGLKFRPTSISFDCMRFGTDGGLIDIKWKSNDGTFTSIGTNLKPARNNSGSGTHAVYDLSSFSIPESEGDCALYIYVYSLGNTKSVGLANIVIDGVTNGSVSNVATFKLNTSVYPANAGTISTFPVGTVFDSGTEISLTASSGNFGYKFKEWQDNKGHLLSSVSPYKFNITCDTSIVAVYEELTTYEFRVDILGSKWGKVSLSPAPVNGRYESGTTVTMSVVKNPVTNFNFWEDNSTTTSRTVLVDKNISLSATFDEKPFITGWDFNPTNPNASRAGDYYSETTNTGLLNVYNQDGSVASWLGHAGAFSPTYPCAYLWTASTSFTTNRRYWVASFSTAGYSNIQIKSMMAGSYQHYKNQIIKCSLDGNNFENLDTLELSTSSWQDLNSYLPSKYENQERIYIKWIADTNSTLVGEPTGNDGTAITNIFVFADKSATNDTIEPKLVSSVPVEGYKNATANGSIVLTFNEGMKVGQGNCTLGSTVLEPAFGSKTVTFAYTKLSYNTEYTFIVPSGAILDKAGNSFDGVTIHFKTMNRPQPLAKTYDLVVAKDGSGDFSSIQAAINAAPQNRLQPYLIFIKNGLYKGHVDIPANKPFIHLIGQQSDSVIISDARLSGKSSAYPDSVVYSVNQGATVVVNSSDCFFGNITFENKFGFDNVSGPQALALYTLGDRIILDNCCLRSFQDTYLTTYNNLAYRHYLKDCRIEGAVDFIYGGGDVFFDKCTIFCRREAGGYVVAPSHQTGTKWGYVFNNCIIDGPDNNYTTYLGRPWANSPMASFFNTIVKIKIYPVGWYYKMGAIPAIFADYNTMDSQGNSLDLSQRISQYEYDVKDANGNVTNIVKGTAKSSFTDIEAARYTYENVTSGSDGWDPKSKTETTEAPQINISNNIISWNPVDYAISYVIFRDNIVIGFSKSTSFTDLNTVNGKSYNYSVCSVNESGILSVKSNIISSGTGAKVEKVNLNKPEIIIKNNILTATNLKANSRLALYSVNGFRIFNDTSKASSYSLDLSGRKGVYILKVDNNIYKIAL